MLSIKVEPEDTFIWDEKTNREINIPGSYGRVLEDTVTATTESVSSGWAQENQNGFKKDKACETYQEKGMEDFPIQVTVKVEGDEFFRKDRWKRIVGLMAIMLQK
ncbi:hypothetical protein HOLleu_15631 [Holothuria leucospilota]|uniref:Uncharacterized protein n=1 Tax=Holothuria leucospilota TaxID=206669 RepID=A0A9Q1C4V3_HOLLE|nr:hypothetical protein HOLleu_15631 [Holothuria leucospilota]